MIGESGPLKKENFRQGNYFGSVNAGLQPGCNVLKNQTNEQTNQKNKKRHALIFPVDVALKNISVSKLPGHLINVHDSTFIIFTLI